MSYGPPKSLHHRTPISDALVLKVIIENYMYLPGGLRNFFDVSG